MVKKKNTINVKGKPKILSIDKPRGIPNDQKIRQKILQPFPYQPSLLIDALS